MGGSPNSTGHREALDRAVRIGVSPALIRCTRASSRFLLVALCALLSACSAKKHPPPSGPSEEGGSSGADGAAGATGNNGTGGQGGSAGSAMAGSAGGLNLGAAGTGPEEPACIAGQECRSFCAAFGSDPSGCGLGDPSQCKCICEERFNEPCPDELAALLACAGPSASVDCASRGRIFPGCERESFDLELCDFRGRERLCAQSYPRCTSYCEADVLAFCPLGAKSLTSCLCGCETSLAGRCEAQFNAFMGCSADAPAFSCDGNGRTVAGSCLSEWQALDGCVNGTPPDAGN